MRWREVCVVAVIILLIIGLFVPKGDNKPTPTKNPTSKEVATLTLPDAQVITSRKSGSELVVIFPVGDISYTTVQNNEQTEERK